MEESRAECEGFDAFALVLEGLALDPDRLGSLADLSMSQRLDYSCRGDLLFLNAFRSRFGFRQLVSWIDPPPASCLRNRNRGDSAPFTSFGVLADAKVPQHAVIAGCRQDEGVYFARPDINRLKP